MLEEKKNGMDPEAEETEETLEPEETAEPEEAEAETEEAAETEEDPESGDPAEAEDAEEAEDAGEAEEGAEGEEAAEAEEPEEKGGRRRSVRHKKELEKKDQKIAELNDRLLRAQAEFINYRNRTDREKALRYDDGAMGVLMKILPVVDDLERGFSLVPDDKKDDPFVVGMEKIYKGLMTTLEDLGVKPIEAVGGEFDPDFHNAVMHVDEEGAGENVVVEEFQKGYMYKDSVLRHSMVKVAN